MSFVWAGIALAAIIIDLITSTFLFVCFSAGALCAFLAAILGVDPTFQVLIFLVVSALCIIFAYPQMKKLLNKTVKETFTPEDMLVGKKIILEEDVAEFATIKIDGIFRTIKNTGEPLRKGERALITGIEGAKLLVVKEENSNG